MAGTEVVLDAASAGAPTVGAKEFAFVSWAGSDGRRACPLATFGSREPRVLHARLACAEPPRADQPELTNAEELRGAVALVVRGGCTFAHKARLLQRAGARAMLLANNTREEPLAAFTMGESPEELAANKASAAENITLPCVMMCLRDVRELFQKFPPSVKTGAVTFEILPAVEAATVADKCLLLQQQQQEMEQAGRGWKAIKRTTTSIMKLLEPQTASPSSTSSSSNAPDAQTPIVSEKSQPTAFDSEPVPGSELAPKQPLFAFVQWATSASSYETHFAPLADFCEARDSASYVGKLVACDPLLAHEDPLRNPEQLRGSLVLIQRGDCPFPEKLARVQRAGAVAAIMGNDDEKDPDTAFVMSVDHIDAANATLPAVMVSRNIFRRLLDGPRSVTSARVLCLSGEAAEGLLENSGLPVTFKQLPMPVVRASKNGGGDNPDRLYALHQASRAGDHGACQRVLAEVEGDKSACELVRASCAKHRLTALHHACAGGNDNVVELLLKLGAAPDAMDLAMVTPLHVACTYGRANCTRLLLHADGGKTPVPLALGGNFDDNDDGGIAMRRNIGGGTALHAAAQAGSAECVELLLTTNARVDEVDGQEEARPDVKYRFLGVNFKDMDGRTPLHLACGEAHEECALYLMAANADVNILDNHGRSPLLLACEAANDPENEEQAAHIIEKLVAAGANMADPKAGVDEVSTHSTGRLLLDRIESSMLRRNLEISYLRYEADKARSDNMRLQAANSTMAGRLNELETEVKVLKEQTVEHESHGRELGQLRVQMQTMLQFLSAQQSSFASLATDPVHPTDSLPNQLLASAAKTLPLESGDRDEEASALDAALARDLGKKAFRQRQWALAETYFQRSLKLLPLPGVQRLLEKAREVQKEKFQDDKQESKVFYPRKASSTATVPFSDSKQETIERFRRSLYASEANHPAQTSLEREINKLEALQEGTTEFAVTCRWLKWLLALPWADPTTGLQNADLYTSKQNVFQQLEVMELEAQNVHKHCAAKIIQRAFREHYAVHLLTRAMAAASIQTLIRGHFARKRVQALKEHRAKYANEASVGSALVGGDIRGAPQASEMEYTTCIDPILQRKLPHEYRCVELIAGEHFRWIDRHSDDNHGQDASTSEFRVVQLVRSERAAQHIAKEEPSVLLDYFVWTRWGHRVDAPCQSALSGPYDNVEDAQRRYMKIVRSERIRGSVAIHAESSPSTGHAKSLDGDPHVGKALQTDRKDNPAGPVASA